MPKFNIELHGIAAEIDVAVLQTHFFVGEHRIARQKWQWLRNVQHAQLFRDQLYLSGGNVPVDRIGIALLHGADDGNDVLVAQGLGFVVDSSVQFVVEHYLRDAAAIAQIDKDDLAKVAPAVHPSHQDGFLTGVGEAQSPAHMSSP